MDDSELLRIWSQAARIDRSLAPFEQYVPQLKRRELRPDPYSRDLLFARMSRGEPLLATGVHVPVAGERSLGTCEAFLRALRDHFPAGQRVRVRRGKAGIIRWMTVPTLLERWAGANGPVNVTDMHVRGTGVFRRVDCSALCDFNLLPECGEPASDQEMMTVVVSSAGAYSDSHSDAPDGSNHCFAGRKLWLAWDSTAGLRRGLEDVERSYVTDRAKFDLPAFLSVPGSRWFIVEPGRTLFLPGHMAHKVITLEAYLGIGSFFVMLPSYLRTLERWARETPLWALGAPADRRMALVDQITRRVIRKIQTLGRAPRASREQWGLEYIKDAARRIAANEPTPDVFRQSPGDRLLQVASD